MVSKCDGCYMFDMKQIHKHQILQLIVIYLQKCDGKIPLAFELIHSNRNDIETKTFSDVLNEIKTNEHDSKSDHDENGNPTQSLIEFIENINDLKLLVELQTGANYLGIASLRNLAYMRWRDISNLHNNNQDNSIDNNATDFKTDPHINYCDHDWDDCNNEPGYIKLVCLEASETVETDELPAIFTITKDAAKLCGYFRMNGNFEWEPYVENNVIYIRKVYKNILKLIVDYLNHHDGKIPAEIGRPIRSVKMEHIVEDPWDAEFIDSLSKKVIFQIILGANYLDIPSLLHLGCAKIATFIKGKSEEEIKIILADDSDYDDESKTQEVKEQCTEQSSASGRVQSYALQSSDHNTGVSVTNGHGSESKSEQGKKERGKSKTKNKKKCQRKRKREKKEPALSSFVNIEELSDRHVKEWMGRVLSDYTSKSNEIDVSDRWKTTPEFVFDVN